MCYVALVKVARTGKSRREFTDLRVIALPIGTHTITILPVPLGPADWKISDLTPSFTHIPRLGDELHPLEHGILMNDVEKAAEFIHLVQFARECGR